MTREKRMSNAKCIVRGCVSRESEGTFQGALCMPCYLMISRGQVGVGETFIHGLVKKVQIANAREGMIRRALEDDF